jgi:hypothetical protein
MAELPPDLARLGDDLVGAARRTAARRRRTRRFAVATATGALAFAALTPATLDPAHRAVTFADGAGGYEPPGCEHPRGARFTMAACESSWTLNRPAAWPSYS